MYVVSEFYELPYHIIHVLIRSPDSIYLHEATITEDINLLYPAV